ncbi:hypothetical protein M728_001110 [Ensifer sp. WSM1721]|uniref:hypothetical protein n=1 Tax=Ensifer sp. WSM1721 TaxID=1041159 RepID=UPI000478D830|nr:hypothetical protein [Ensifer sp. WSM1721]
MNFHLNYPDLGRFRKLTPQQVGWLLAEGVRMSAVMRPPIVMLAHGFKADDGLFEEHAHGEPFLVFPEAEDCIFWQPRSGAMATWNGRGFAVGEDLISAASTCSFDGNLNVFANPLDWLRWDRDGIVIVNLSLAFDRLRDVPRVAVAESLLPTYRKHMQPARMPELFVLREHKGAAA